MKALARIGSLLLVVASLAIVLAPSMLTGPTRAQTEGHLSLAYNLDRWRMPIALVALLVVGAVTALQWRNHAGTRCKIVLGIGVLLACAAVWGSTTNIPQLMFTAIADGGRYVSLAEADHVAPDDLILGIQRDGDALIYPVKIVGYHHIVNERLKGEPFVVTY